jgi:NADPH:quinone reductase-like Zn-dependent oxidoreductase
MRAVIFREFGGPEVLQTAELPEPNLRERDILVSGVVVRCGSRTKLWPPGGDGTHRWKGGNHGFGVDVSFDVETDVGSTVRSLRRSATAGLIVA